MTKAVTSTHHPADNMSVTWIAENRMQLRGEVQSRRRFLPSLIGVLILVVVVVVFVVVVDLDKGIVSICVIDDGLLDHLRPLRFFGRIDAAAIVVVEWGEMRRSRAPFLGRGRMTVSHFSRLII